MGKKDSVGSTSSACTVFVHSDGVHMTCIRYVAMRKLACCACDEAIHAREKIRKNH